MVKKLLRIIQIHLQRQSSLVLNTRQDLLNTVQQQIHKGDFQSLNHWISGFVVQFLHLLAFLTQPVSLSMGKNVGMGRTFLTAWTGRMSTGIQRR